MKTIGTLILLALTLWSAPLFAEYCKVDAEENKTSCIYKIDRIPKNTQIVISYTQQGWSMLIVVFRKEFAIIEGDSIVTTKDGPEYPIKYVSTRRDMTQGMMMEAALYLIEEEALKGLAQAGGKVRFMLANTVEKEPVEVEVAASQFEAIDAFIAETKTVLGALFEKQ